MVYIMFEAVSSELFNWISWLFSCSVRIKLAGGGRIPQRHCTMLRDIAHYTVDSAQRHYTVDNRHCSETGLVEIKFLASVYADSLYVLCTVH